jgi:hypothetical protein
MSLNLVSALQAQFDLNTNLTGLFLNGLENGLSADLNKLPNCLLVEAGVQSNYTTPNDKGIAYRDVYLMQFTVRSASGTQVGQALAYLRSTFDHKPLTVNDGEVLIDARLSNGGQIYKEDERVYRADAEYRFEICGGL